MQNMYKNALVSNYKDIPQQLDAITSNSKSESSLSQQSGSKNLLSVQLSGIKNGVGGKSKDYFFEKENDDYKNFLSRC